MSYTNPRLSLNIAPEYWQRVPKSSWKSHLAISGSMPRQAATKQMNALAAGLKEMGLAIYRNTMWDCFIVGFTDAATQHAHDRWVLRSMDTAEGIIWLSAVSETKDAHPVYTSLYDAVAQFSYGCMIPTARVQHATAYSFSDVFKRWQLLNGDDTENLQYARHIRPELDLIKLHDMLHHFPTWVKTHPEFADVPQDLVLRAHGFGAPLDAGYRTSSLDIYESEDWE